MCVTLIQLSHALAKLDSECEIASELLPGMQDGVKLASMLLAEAMEVLAASHAKMQVEMSCCHGPCCTNSWGVKSVCSHRGKRESERKIQDYTKQFLVLLPSSDRPLNWPMFYY